MNAVPTTNQLEKYDCFICYNSEEKELAKEFKRRLEELNVRCWIDEEKIPPWGKIRKEIDAALRQSSCIVILIGVHGIGPWQNDEIEVALGLEKELGILVVLVALPGAPQNLNLPVGLPGRLLSDFREGWFDRAIEKLVSPVLKRSQVQKLEGADSSEKTLPPFQKAIAEPSPETSSSRDNAADVFKKITERLESLLADVPEMRKSLKSAIEDATGKQFTSSAKIGSILVNLHLVEVLKVVAQMLKRGELPVERAKVMELINLLAASGPTPNWVKQVRDICSQQNQSKNPREILVPASTKLYTAELIKAAVLGAPAVWDKSSAGGDPRGRDGIEVGVEGAGPSKVARLDEFSTNIWARFPALNPRSPSDIQELDDRLWALWELGEPLYALLAEEDVAWDRPVNPANIPLTNILIMRSTPKIGEVISRPGAVAQFLTMIFTELGLRSID